MKKILILGLIVAAVGAGVFIAAQKFPAGHRHSAGQDVYYCPMHPQITSDKPGECPICYMKLVKKDSPGDATKEKTGHDLKTHAQDAYYCPMHPQITSDKPGECPICYMKLVKKKSGPASAASTSARSPDQQGLKDHAAVHLDEHQQQMMGLKTAEAGVHRLSRKITTVGLVAHDPELYRLQTEYLAAVAQWERLSEAGASAESLSAAQLFAESARMHLLHNGFHEGLIRDLEARGTADQSLFFNHGGDVWIYAPVYEYELPAVAVGQKSVVDVVGIEGAHFEGAIKAIDPVLQPQTRSARVRILVHDPDAVLKPEMTASVEIMAGERDVLAVPAQAVMDTGVSRIVFVENADGTFEPRRVSAGLSSGGFTEILGGLEPGERVVTEGNFLLDSESRLKATLEASVSTPDPHAGH